MYNNFQLPEIFGALTILMIFFLFVIFLIVISLWVFSALGLMNLARKKNISNPWIAFLPFGYSYIVGKLGYEIYPSEEKKNATLTWITFGLSIASFVFSITNISGLINVALLVFHAMAFYNIFNALTRKKIVFTVFTIVSYGLLGGVFLYAIRNTEDYQKESFKEQDEEKNEPVESEDKKESVPKNFCISCGTKLIKNAKFCSNCGKKVD